MGWIINRGSPADQLHKVAGQVEVERTRSNSNSSTERPRRNTYAQMDDPYPIQPKRTPDKDLTYISASEVQKRDGKDGNRLFIVVDDIVLDCTNYINRHPGGKQIVQGFGGQNCGWQWWTFHNRQIWNEVAANLRVGRTEGMENRFIKPPTYIGLRPFGYQDD